MAYTRNPTWQNSPSTATPITAAALETIENGLVAAAGVADGKLDPTTASATYRTQVDPRLTTLKTWYAALAKRDTTLATASIVGDSFVEGGKVTTRTRTSVVRLQQRLRTRMPSDTVGTGGGYGYFPAVSTGAFGPDVAAGGAITVHNEPTAAYGLGRFYLSLNDATAFDQFPSQVCTGFDIYFTGVTAANSFQYKIDGGAAVTVSTQTATNGLPGTIFQVRGLSAAAHVITILGTATATILEGIRFYNGDEAQGIQVLNAGHSGNYTYHFNDLNDGNGDGWKRALVTSGSSLVCLLTGTNDATTLTSAQRSANVATFFSSLNTYYSAAGVAVPSKCLITPYQRTNGSTVEPWANYVAADKAAAAAAGAHWIDLGRSLSSPNTTSGLYDTDQIHPNDNGHSRFADAFLADLIPSF